MIKKILLILFTLLVIIVAALSIFVSVSWNKQYDIPLVELEVSTDSAVIERGRYLAHGPAHCSNCHVSSYDDMIAADKGENIPLQGGVLFPMNPLGEMSPANLTSDPETGLGRYSDGQVFRMMRHAVKPDGTASLALMMPFWNMADEDLIAIVSYLRTLDPIKNDVAPASWTVIGKMVRALAPTFKPIFKPNPPAEAPRMAATVERGEYLARYVANCVGCHTPRDPMTFEAIGEEYSGGMEMEPMPAFHRVLGVDEDLWTRSPNITPHSGGALALYPTLESWIARFRDGRRILHSPMHWGPFSKMSDEDLEALYKYLNSLDPVEQEVGDIVFKKE